MRIDNYIARLVRRSEGSDGPRIQELLSEISDFKRKYAGELAELERHCSTTRARDNNTGGDNDDGAKRLRTSPYATFYDDDEMDDL